MSSRPELKIAWATHEAALYACQRWHYTKKIPVNKLVKVGAWENEKFIGVVIFGMGASAVLHRQFDLGRFEVCELVRVALGEHVTPVSRIISIALKFLVKANPGLKLCVSFADPSQGHHGGIYQAGNWVYTGDSADTTEYFYNGDWRHVTDVYKRLTSDQIKRLPKRSKKGKYRYVMALDAKLRETVGALAKPYPKRAGSKAVVAPVDQAGEDGSTPIPALHKSRQRREVGGAER